MTYLASCFATPAIFLGLGLTLPDSSLRKSLGPMGLLVYLGWLSTNSGLSAPERLFCCSLWLLYFIKGWALLKVPRDQLTDSSPLGLLLYSYLWPGVDTRAFYQRGACDSTAATWFVRGFPTMCLGIASFGLLCLNSDALSSGPLGLAGLATILVAVHLGYSDILSCGMRLLGFPVNRLFDQPLKATSLRDFWSHRWNRPFVEMNKLLFAPLLSGYLSRSNSTLALFLLSGLLHELALSYPVSAGFGGPLLYFLVQGLGMRIEKSFKERARWKSQLWTWGVLLLPLPLLFHQSFRAELVLPLIDSVHQLPTFQTWPQFFETFLTLAGYGHFLVLCASFQVPYRLNWSEELSRLRPLNRKLLWTYGGYIASFILLWGVLSLLLKDEFLAGDKSSLVLLIIIALFWWSRIVIDALYFEHSDWPEGVEFLLGHTCLTTLFVTLASTYTGLLAWHFFT